MSTQPQHLAALQRANAHRFARAELRRRVRDGELDLAELLRGDHDDLEVEVSAGTVRAFDAIGKTKVADLVLWERNFGPARSARVTRHAGITARARLIDLTPRQRGVLPEAFVFVRRGYVRGASLEFVA